MAFFLTLIMLGFINEAFTVCQDRSEETIILYVRRSKICHHIFMKTALGMIAVFSHTSDSGVTYRIFCYSA